MDGMNADEEDQILDFDMICVNLRLENSFFWRLVKSSGLDMALKKRRHSSLKFILP